VTSMTSRCFRVEKLNSFNHVRIESQTY